MKTMTREQQLTDLSHELYNAFGRKDLQTILNHLDPKVEWQHFTPVVSMRGLRRGPQQVREYFEAFAKEAEILKFTPEKFLADGDTLVVLGTVRCRIRQNGKELNATWVHHWTFKGEKVARYRGYTEADTLIEAYS